MFTSDYVISLFREWGQTTWVPEPSTVKALDNYLHSFNTEDFVGEHHLKLMLTYLVNSRLQINKSFYRKFIDENAKIGITFNYHEKLEIEESICHIDFCFHDWVSEKFNDRKISISLVKGIEQARNKSLPALDSYLSSEKKSEEILNSLFSSFIYAAFKESRVHRILNRDCKKEYKERFFDHLEVHHNNQINRRNGLSIVDLSEFNDSKEEYECLLSKCLSKIKNIYDDLDNHSYIAFIIGDKIASKWSLISDISIFCEKFIEHDIDKAYFRKEEIKNTTKKYIKKAKEDLFDVTNEGLHYKDCYITYNENNDETIVLLFEKNHRDEGAIPCPKCRTLNIQGNSYPILGVKSWECKNQFCGDKSKFNRGKRYSLSSIIRQEAINNDDNIIPKELLNKWRRDIVYGVSHSEIIEFLIRFYSLHDDEVVYFNSESKIKDKIYGRKVVDRKFSDSGEVIDLLSFKNLSFFKKFIVDKEPTTVELKNLSDIDGLDLLQGDAFEILCSLKSEIISGAVTSPPYYNARDYSTWPNIYCYLYDMYNIGSQVFRVLQSGAPFVFNIFDYFDNENSIVFSAMGKKRVILSSYISYIFRQVGFIHVGNCAWDKGEIQGNRNFNQGNLSPYYQAPHNCWEHVMIFSKGTPLFDVESIPKSIREKPVFKIKKGVNTYGHTAPYPAAIPKLLLDLIKKDEITTILDPFSGSMTSGREAHMHGVNSINVELHREYCDLSMKMLKESIINSDVQTDLFST